MPRKTLKITDFSGGLVTKSDPTDIKDVSSGDLVNLCSDISGKLRILGVDRIAEGVTTEVISGILNPGYGLFSFGGDYSVTDNLPKNTHMLTIPQFGNIGIFDGVGDSGLNSDEIQLVDSSDPDDQTAIQHVFYNVATNNTGGLRVSDGNFDNENDYPKVYQYIKKTWFHGITNFNGGDGIPLVPGYDTVDSSSTGDWLYQSSHLFPPSVATDGSRTHQLFSIPGISTALHDQLASALYMEAGCIAVRIEYDDSPADQGSWVKDSAMKFGISFVYDAKEIGLGGGGQESLITNFAHTFDSTGASADDYMLKITMYSCFADSGEDIVGAAGDGNDDFIFDSRLVGVNLYWTGDSEGDFTDPYFVAYWHWGTSDSDTSYIEAHSGERVIDIRRFTDLGNALTGVYNGTEMIVRTQPDTTFELINQYSPDTQTTAARYKSAVVANRRVFIGGIQRYEFDRNIIADVVYDGVAIGQEHIIESKNQDFSEVSDWTNDGSNGFTSYNESSSSGVTTEGTYFTDNYLGVAHTAGAGVGYAHLDEDEWKGTGSVGGAMIEGNTYRLSYSIEITAYTSGIISVGFSDDSFALYTHYKQYIAVMTTPERHTVDFVYGSTDKKIIIHATSGSAFTAYFDNFSIKEVKSAGDRVSAYRRNCFKECALIRLDANLDTILYSPVSQFDCFPSDNFIDAAVNDGESIITLKAFANKILQFKEKTLYIIDISAGERLEFQGKFLGIKSPYQAIETEFGVAWFNELGLFLYDGESDPVNLTDESLNQLTYKDYFIPSSIIGYLPDLKQLIVMTVGLDPFADTYGGFVFYDMISKTFSIGKGLVYGGIKSNVISDYNNKCIYLTQQSVDTGESFDSEFVVQSGVDAKWTIADTFDSYDFDDRQLKIGTTNITSPFSYNPNDFTWGLGWWIKYQIDLQSEPALSTELNFATGVLTITRKTQDIISGDLYSGNNLTWSPDQPDAATTIGVSATNNNNEDSTANVYYSLGNNTFDPGGSSGQSYSFQKTYLCWDDWNSNRHADYALIAMHSSISRAMTDPTPGVDKYFSSVYTLLGQATGPHHPYGCGENSLRSFIAGAEGNLDGDWIGEPSKILIYRQDGENWSGNNDNLSFITIIVGSDWDYPHHDGQPNVGTNNPYNFQTGYHYNQASSGDPHIGIEFKNYSYGNYLSDGFEEYGGVAGGLSSDFEYTYIKLPSVVWRRLDGGSVESAFMVISLFGDFSSSIFTNIEYNITGDSNYCNASNITFRDVEVVSQPESDYSITLLSLMAEDTDNNLTAFSVAEGSGQLRTHSSNSNTITFTQSSAGELDIDNTNKTGTIATGRKYFLHPDRGGVIDDGVQYTTSILSHTGNHYNINKITAIQDTGIEVASLIAEDLNQLRVGDSAVSDPGLWVSEGISNQSGLEATLAVFGGNLVQVSFNASLEALGIRDGDCFTLDGGDNFNHTDGVYQINGSPAFSASTSVMRIREDLVSSVYLSVFPGSATTYTGVEIKTSVISITSKYVADNSDLIFMTVGADVSGSIDCKQYQNTPGHPFFVPNMYYRSKVFDFGDPSTAKAIYKVSLQYRLYDFSGTNVAVLFLANESLLPLYPINSPAGPFLPVSNNFNITRNLDLFFDSSIIQSDDFRMPVKCKTGRLVIQDNNSSVIFFELLGFTIYYRDLNR